MNFQSQLQFFDHFSEPAGDLLIYDNRLKALPGVENWIAQHEISYGVDAGEGLKSLQSFPAHMEELLKLVDQSSLAKPCVVALGGGSIGDFAGFAASVIKRGLPFVQVPSTFLAAIDSAHGGKTALNSATAKNQIGSFYPAKEVRIYRSLLEALPQAQLEDAFGELFKMALLRGGSLWGKVKDISAPLSFKAFWESLPEAIEGKYDFVLQDPYEEKGIRHCLNLGHTLGHVWESAQGMSHGRAVGAGLIFAIEFSRNRGLLSEPKYTEVTKSSGYYLQDLIKGCINPLSEKDLESLLRKDKKKSGQSMLRFVFVEKPGCFKIENIKIKDLIEEVGRQGLLL